MIEIINERGLTLDLPDQLAVPIERHNPLFAEGDSFFQDITYPATAPLTESNKRFIAGGHLVETSKSAYEMTVIVLHAGTLHFTGILHYKLIDDEISFILKVNFGEVAQLARTVMLTDLAFKDGLPVLPGQPPYFTTESITNPDAYPFAYFPVGHHDYLGYGDEEKVDFIVNNYDFGTQAFKPHNPGATAPADVTRWSPHFKLSYVLKRVLNYLGYAETGSFWASDDARTIYIHSELTLSPTRLATEAYLPAIKISDFLQAVKERLRVSVMFDAKDKTARVDTLQSAIDNPHPLDISQYVSAITEISTAEHNGYSVTLGPWEQDSIFNPSGREPSALVQLIVGLGEKELEVKVSTLSQKESDAGYRFPVSGITRRNHLPGDAYWKTPSETNRWPMRLLRFRGLREIVPGQYWPEATSLDLFDDDADWYRFMNDSKRVKVSAYVPSKLLPLLHPTAKIGFISEQGTFQLALAEVVRYNLSANREELTHVEIDVRTLVASYLTPYEIKPLVPEETPDGFPVAAVKFMFNQSLIPKVEFDAFVKRELDPLLPPVVETPATIVGEVIQSADADYVGGSVCHIYHTEPWMWQLVIKLPATYPLPGQPYCKGRVPGSWTIQGSSYSITINLYDLPFQSEPIVIPIG